MSNNMWITQKLKRFSKIIILLSFCLLSVLLFFLIRIRLVPYDSINKLNSLGVISIQNPNGITIIRFEDKKDRLFMGGWKIIHSEPNDVYLLGTHPTTSAQMLDIVSSQSIILPQINTLPGKISLIIFPTNNNAYFLINGKKTGGINDDYKAYNCITKKHVEKYNTCIFIDDALQKAGLTSNINIQWLNTTTPILAVQHTEPPFNSLYFQIIKNQITTSVDIGDDLLNQTKSISESKTPTIHNLGPIIWNENANLKTGYGLLPFIPKQIFALSTTKLLVNDNNDKTFIIDLTDKKMADFTNISFDNIIYNPKQ